MKKVNMTYSSKKILGEILLELNVINEEQLEMELKFKEPINLGIGWILSKFSKGNPLFSRSGNNINVS